MSTTPIITMIDPSGTARSVPADGVAQAPTDWKPATKMIDTQGTPRWIPTEAMDQAKTAGYVIHPDSMQRPIPTKGDDTSESGQFGTAALPKGYKGSPNKNGQLATDEEVNARAAATNAALSPEQKRALSFSDSAQETAGKVMTGGAAVGATALAAPLAVPIARAAAPIVVKQGIKYGLGAAVGGGAAHLGWSLAGKWIEGLFK